MNGTFFPSCTISTFFNTFHLQHIPLILDIQTIILAKFKKIPGFSRIPGVAKPYFHPFFWRLLFNRQIIPLKQDKKTKLFVELEKFPQCNCCFKWDNEKGGLPPNSSLLTFSKKKKCPLFPKFPHFHEMGHFSKFHNFSSDSNPSNSKIFLTFFKLCALQQFFFLNSRISKNSQFSGTFFPIQNEWDIFPKLHHFHIFHNTFHSSWTFKLSFCQVQKKFQDFPEFQVLQSPIFTLFSGDYFSTRFNRQIIPLKQDKLFVELEKFPQCNCCFKWDNEKGGLPPNSSLLTFKKKKCPLFPKFPHFHEMGHFSKFHNFSSDSNPSNSKIFNIF
nr:uncharacterized protein LOC133620526 [Nerophis lumbriciformis]